MFGSWSLTKVEKKEVIFVHFFPPLLSKATLIKCAGPIASPYPAYISPVTDYC